MRNMFNTMTNVTDANYHKSMGRGVVAGPSVVMRGNRVKTDIFNFVPPSINAGCGGIDMFLGSFSFIDADHFVNLLQSIATNASGYAFKMALSIMCPTCDNIVTSLQRAMHSMNSMAGDSCRIAEKGVNVLAKEMDTAGLAKAIEDGPLGSLAKNVGDKADAFATFLDKVNKGSNSKDLDDDQIKALLGNVAWRVLQRDGFIGRAFAFGDNELAEALMSVTGTIIGTKGNDDDDTPRIIDKMPILNVKDILEGASEATGDGPKRYMCLNSDCVDIATVDYTFKGLEQWVKELLLGANLDASGEDSFIYKLLSNQGSLSIQEKQLIRVAPYHMARLRNMAVCAGPGNMGSVPEYAQKAARLIALEVLQRYLKDSLSAMNQIAQGDGRNIGDWNFGDALVPKFLARIKEVQKDLNEEAAALQSDLPTALEEVYKSATANCNLTPAHLNIPKYKTK